MRELSYCQGVAESDIAEHLTYALMTSLQDFGSKSSKDWEVALCFSGLVVVNFCQPLRTVQFTEYQILKPHQDR